MRDNAIAERWIASARRACLDRMLVTGDQHLQLVLSDYVDHYNSHRPHRTLQQNPPAGTRRPPAEESGMRVLRRDRLGGLIHEYAQVAYGDIVFRHPQAGAWICFEDEAGQTLRPPKARTWAPRGRTPVVRVSGKGSTGLISEYRRAA